MSKCKKCETVKAAAVLPGVGAFTYCPKCDKSKPKVHPYTDLQERLTLKAREIAELTEALLDKRTQINELKSTVFSIGKDLVTLSDHADALETSILQTCEICTIVGRCRTCPLWPHYQAAHERGSSHGES